MWAQKSICEEPLTYRIGYVDNSFYIREEDLLVYIDKAAKMWEKAYGKRLFVYDPNSDLEINLIYDERQKELTTLEKIEEEVENKVYTLEEQNVMYEKRLDEIKKKAEELNSEINYWNKKGGAPEDVYNDLTDRQDELALETRELNRMGDALNKNVDEVNQDIEYLNDEVGDFNSLLGSKPEIGYYTSGEHKIDVFFYTDEDYLVNTLAHEMGHALGLGHISQSGALMNPVLSENTGLTFADETLIKNFCAENSKVNIIRYRVNELVYRIFASLSFKN